MSFRSLHHVLGGLQNQYQHREQNQFQQVMRCWADVVGPVVAVQTRPLNLYRGVLKVATSSAAWAQNLVFERQRILDKLKQVTALPITDIRFSPAHWQEKPVLSFPGDQLQQELWQAHPSRFSATSIHKQLGNTAQAAGSELEKKDANSAFQQWSAQMRLRSRNLPLCPECHCPTPKGELERWAVCSICVAKRWS